MEKLFELLESPEAGVLEEVKALIDQQVSWLWLLLDLFLPLFSFAQTR